MKKILLAFLFSIMLLSGSAQAGTNGEEVQNFVKRFYVEVLDREAEPTGLNDWTNRLTTGHNAGSDVATGFVFSAEFTNREKNNEEFINILYSAFFDRAADTGGFDGWMTQLQNATSREDVLNGFLYSTEFANLCTSYGIRAVPEQESADAAGGTVVDFVKRFYSVILNREADIAGLNDWVEKLTGGGCSGCMLPSATSDKATAAEIATGFVFSAEFISRDTNNEEFIRILYKAFFNRAADEGGFNGWMTQMNNGASREDVLNGFIHSKEFINLCNGYQIIAYEGAPIYKVSTSTNDYSTSEYTYDANGNMLTYSATYINWDDSTSTSSGTYTYNANANILTYSGTGTDSDGGTSSNTSTYTYDANGNMLEVSSTGTNADGGTSSSNTTFTYDENGNMLTYSGTNANSDGSTSSYSTTYTYDANGNMLTYSGTNANSDGSTSSYSGTYTYDANDNMLTALYTSTYDGSTSSSSTTYTYDANGNMLTSSSTNTESDGTTSSYSTTYTYDANGNKLTSLSADSDTTTLYAWDSRGQRIIQGSTSPEFTEYTYYSYTYDADNNLISSTENGTVTLTQEWVKVN